MPRNGSDIYSIPPGTEGFPDTTIESEKYNNYIHDVETDLNLPRPVSMGGTGATSADGALVSLHAEKAGQQINNFDSDVWMAGSFYSLVGATAPPVAGHAFSGIAHITNANNMVVEAVDLTDPLNTPWMRVKTAGVWGAWIQGVTKSNQPSIIASDTPPTGNNAIDNSLWFESDSGLLYIRYNDGDSTQWTIACPQPDISTYAIKTDVDTALALKAPIDSPIFTGNPTAPTPTAGDNDTSIATTAFVAATALTACASSAVLYSTAQSLTAAQQQQARQNIGAPAANLIINGDFRVNQVGYVSAAVLSAGTYGHDQWKAGSGGGDYSFTQLKSSTQITIAAGKSLIQPIEDVNVVGGSYVLSWTGTAQARAGINTLTPSGSYAGSPLLIAGQTAGTMMSIEFNNGTLGTVKLESGANATPFVMQSYDQELLMCMRYWQKMHVFNRTNAASGGASHDVGGFFNLPFRITPALSLTAGSRQNVSAVTLYDPSSDGAFRHSAVSTNPGDSFALGDIIVGDARL